MIFSIHGVQRRPMKETKTSRSLRVNAVNLRKRKKIKEFSTTRRHGQERITIIVELEAWIYSRKILEIARMKPSAFTRNRQLTLPR
ncbi:hypothetical protein LEP1GSC133_0276 [Leptospira borgpetersenii serovar Pomona str. 200901868]|uniref:Uncharacterized protein n=1 Tax=Leptospira borgpetersenii serovar Pomona str. 200901868 TaxID=1192866 RepID=M6W7T6_LEPBO|nr:hypothetical protein LEP1GSC133_0276 [Leptospira borgpetersenii serovar Pomona str. 200901868]